MSSAYSKIDKGVSQTEIPLPTSFTTRVKLLINNFNTIGDKLQPCLSPQLTANHSV